MVRAATDTLYLSRNRFLHGLGDFLQALDAQRTLETARQQLVQQHMTLANDVVALYRALGGGWGNPGTPKPSAPGAQRAARHPRGAGQLGSGGQVTCAPAPNHPASRDRGQAQRVPALAAGAAARCRHCGNVALHVFVGAPPPSLSPSAADHCRPGTPLPVLGSMHQRHCNGQFDQNSACVTAPTTSTSRNGGR